MTPAKKFPQLKLHDCPNKILKIFSSCYLFFGYFRTMSLSATEGSGVSSALSEVDCKLTNNVCLKLASVYDNHR